MGELQWCDGVDFLFCCYCYLYFCCFRTVIASSASVIFCEYSEGLVIKLLLD